VQNAFEVRSEGSAFGFELFLKRRLTSRVGGFVSYTLSRSVRTANGRDYVATFDRTHVANAAIAFDLGRMWRAGTRVTFYTGLPKASGDPTDTATRLNPFFRLDLRIEKRWQLGRTAWLSFVAEWLNALLAKEEVATTCTLKGCDACVLLERDTEPRENYRLATSGTFRQTGTLAVQPTATTALGMKSDAVTITGTVYDPPIPYEQKACPLLSNQDDSKVTGTLCGRDFSTLL